jgi:hypothetical protein
VSNLDDVYQVVEDHSVVVCATQHAKLQCVLVLRPGFESSRPKLTEDGSVELDSKTTMLVSSHGKLSSYFNRFMRCLDGAVRLSVARGRRARS